MSSTKRSPVEVLAPVLAKKPKSEPQFSMEKRGRQEDGNENRSTSQGKVTDPKKRKLETSQREQEAKAATIENDSSTSSNTGNGHSSSVVGSVLQYDPAGLQPLDAEGFGDKGKKLSMEDRRRLFPDLSLVAGEQQKHIFTQTRYSLFAVFDGHGGPTVSSFLHRKYHENLVELLSLTDACSGKGDISSPRYLSVIQNALIESFKMTDREVLEFLKKNKLEHGSTATVCISVGTTIWTANVGDSKAVLARLRPGADKPNAVPISRDHSPLLKTERERIERQGGYVENGRVLGRLEVSRSFGDPPFKPYGVSCTPFVSKFQVNDQHKFIIIGCDGLWSHFPIQDAVDFVYRLTNDYIKLDVKTIARKLVQEAVVERGAQDNVTAVVILFRDPPKL